MAVRRDAGSRGNWLGYGIQRLRGYGQGALRFAVHICDEASSLGGSRTGRDGWPDADRLPHPDPHAGCFPGGGNLFALVDRGLSISRLTCYASMDSLRKLLHLSAV